MRQILILFMLVLSILACKKEKDEDNNSSTLKITLVSPADGATVQTGKEVQFTWSSSSSNTTVPITHKIKIVEITADQTPEQAFRGNKPIFEKDSMIYLNVSVPSSAGSPGFVAGKNYSWGVTASQKGLTSTGGASSASVFTVIR